MSDLEKRVTALEKENAEMKELFSSLHNRIDKLLELGRNSLNTQIKSLEDAYNYENKLKAVFDELGIKSRP